MSALLVSEEISVNLKTPEGWTALVAAADKGHHDLVKTLLRNKAVDVNVRDNQSELYQSLSQAKYCTLLQYSFLFPSDRNCFPIYCIGYFGRRFSIEEFKNVKRNQNVLTFCVPQW